MHRRAVPWLWVLAVVGCGAPDPDVTRVSLRIELPDAVDCRPADEVTQLRVDGLGDFPFTADSTGLLVPSGEPLRLTDFPPETRVLTLDTTGLEVGPLAWVAAGARFLADLEGTAPILMLPFGRSCPLGDPQLFAPGGAQVAALEDGALLVAGGEGSGGRVVLLPSNTQFSERLAVDLASAAVEGTATTVGRWVVVAGGASVLGGEASDRVALYDHEDGALEPDAARLVAARRAHGSTLLPGGRVLFVGGESGVGGAAVALASAEELAPLDALAEDVAPLPVPRSAPAVVTLDDGRVLVLGGRAAPGAGASSSEVFEYDVGAGEFLAVAASEATVQPFDAYQAVPLAGARVAWIGEPRDGVSFGSECTDPPHCIRVIHRVPPFFGGALLATHDVQLPPFPLLTEVRGVGLPDGKLLLTGRDAASEARAFVVDLGLGTLEEVEASRAPAFLLSLADGTVAELSDSGASLRRALLATPYDRPPATFAAEDLAFDVLGSWTVSDDIHFVAERSDARFDVPALRFADFQVASLAVEGGNADLLLLPRDADPIAVRVLATTVGIPLCETERLAGAPLVLTRRATEITFSAGGASRTCRIPALVGSVGVAVRADAGVVVGNLKIDRL